MEEEKLKRICPVCGKDYSGPELFEAFVRHLSMETSIKSYIEELEKKKQF